MQFEDDVKMMKHMIWYIDINVIAICFFADRKSAVNTADFTRCSIVKHVRVNMFFVHENFGKIKIQDNMSLFNVFSNRDVVASL